jgi:hypothetical protein
MLIVALTLIFIVSAFARLYNSGVSATLTPEVAQHYLEIVKLLDGNLMLDGPLASHSWLRLSSTPYYLFFPIFALFRFHPLTLNYIVTFVSILTVLLNYFVVKKTIDRKTAMVSTILLAVSPLLLLFGRTPGFYSFTIPLLYLLILLTYRIVKNKSSKIWPVFFIIGFMSTLHAASFMLLGIFSILFIFLKKFSRRQTVLSFFAFLVPNIPWVLKDISLGFTMTRDFILWVPYKLFNFLTGQTLGLNRAKVPDTTFIDILDFIKSGIFPPESHIAIGAILFISIIFYFALKKRPLFERVLYYWLISGLIILAIHKNPPIHYFVPVFVLPVILFSKALVSFWVNKGSQAVIITFLTIIFAVNVGFIFSEKYLFHDPKILSEFIPLTDQQRITEILIKDAGNKTYSFSRIGPFDTYPGEFKENYEFLLWRMGNPPKEKSEYGYVLVEGEFKNVKRLKKIGQSGKIYLYKINN